MATLKEVFDRQFDQVVFDKKLCERIIRYSNQFMTRNDDHNAFFGGVLLGVNPIRFLDSDRETWYEDVLGVDEGLLAHDFKSVTAINHEFKVMSDVFNYTPAYITHRLEKETQIPQKLRRSAQIHAFMVLHYRFLTSLLVRRFRYTADPEVARAVYASLSGRFDIRRYGSWRALLEARSEDLTSPNSIYRRTLQNFSPDSGLIRVVTDTQGRIREVVKKIYVVHKAMLDSNTRVKSVSATTVNTDGEMVLKDRKNNYADYLRYADEIIPLSTSFIRDELVTVIVSVMRTVPEQLLRESLMYLSVHYKKPRHDYLSTLVKEDLLYVFDYLQNNRNILRNENDLAGIMMRVKNQFTASRSSDPTVLLLRKHTETLVRAAVKTRNQPVIASVRTAVLLYIILRVLTKQYYSQGR